MTYEEYKEEKRRLKNALAKLEDDFINEGPVHVNDIVTDGKDDFIVRKVKIDSFKGDLVVTYVSKRKKDGNWSNNHSLAWDYKQFTVKDTGVVVKAGL